MASTDTLSNASCRARVVARRARYPDIICEKFEGECSVVY